MNNEIQIPSSFKIFAQEIKVEYDSCLVQKEDAYGLARYRDNKIVLQANTEGYPRSKEQTEQTEQTFLHELVHFILYQIGEEDLKSNEKFVDLFANALHLALRTSVYNNQDKIEQKREFINE